MKKKVTLAIGAHPDDIEIGCSGALLNRINNGHDVYGIIATDGRAGSFKIDPEKLVKIREKEAKNAAKILGLKNLFFLGLKDGLTGYKRNTKLELINLIRKIKPQEVFIHSIHDQSTDHKIIHELSLEALRCSTGPWFKEAGKNAPHKIDKIFGYEVWNALASPTYVEDISQVFSTKEKALMKHKSQVSEFNYIQAIKGLAMYRGALISSSYAEAFQVISI